MSAARVDAAVRRALFAAALVLLLSLASRAAAQDSWWGADKALHFSVSAGLAGGGYALAVPLVDAPWARATIGASFALTLGIAKELYDLSGAGNASWRDLTWDVIGTATGVLIALGIEWLVEALSAPPRGERAAQGPCGQYPTLPSITVHVAPFAHGDPAMSQ